MIRLRPGQLLVADARQRAAPARVLDAGPGERRVEVVGTVHEPGAGGYALANVDRSDFIAGPY